MRHTNLISESAAGLALAVNIDIQLVRRHGKVAISFHVVPRLFLHIPYSLALRPRIKLTINPRSDLIHTMFHRISFVSTV